MALAWPAVNHRVHGIAAWPAVNHRVHGIAAWPAVNHRVHGIARLASSLHGEQAVLCSGQAGTSPTWSGQSAAGVLGRGE